MARLKFRSATNIDITAIVALLADDPLGRDREDRDPPPGSAYHQAFQAITEQAGNQVIVGEIGGEIVACLQLTFIPGLARRGVLRAQIEAVRVDKRFRGERIGERLFAHAIALAREAGCGLVQLTTDATRPDAHRFYERLGFTASHVGMKLIL